VKSMPIPAVGKLITESWASAELGLRKKLSEQYPDSDEEPVTFLFRGELDLNLRKLANSGAVEKAFLSDLKQAFPTIASESLRGITHGLVASVSFHPKRVEGETGGDLGIVIVRPDVQRGSLSNLYLTIEHDYRNGLLCQAKMFRHNSRWGSLTSKQRKTLAAKLSYLALLLYRYADQNVERRFLQPFEWQLARGATIGDVKAWLAEDQFPELLNSRQVLKALIDEKIGTDDKMLIDKYIAPPLRRSLTITIRWKDGQDPGNTVRVQEHSSLRSQQQVVVRR